MQELIEAIKKTEIAQRIGILLTFLFGSIGFAAISALLQIVFLVLSIVLAIITIFYTQEKRAMLKKQQKDIEEP